MNEFQTLLHETVTRLFSDLITQPLLEQTEDGTWPAELWEAIDDCGLTRPHLPEESGGADGTWQDAYLIAHAAGAHTAPVPLVETMLACWLLSEAKLDIPDGPLTVLLNSPDEASVQSGALNTESPRVPWGRQATHAVFACPAGEQATIGLVSLEQVSVEQQENLAREPRDHVQFTNTPIIDSSSTSLPHDIIYRYGAMLRSAQMAGALATMLSQSVQYVTERHQFGRPIGKFQAVQQELARLAGQVAASDIASKAAFRAADNAALRDPFFEIAAAKVMLGEAVELGTSIAHQVHGAIGFTYEHALHFASRRLWSWRAEFGSAESWADQLGKDALAHGADALWPFVTSR